jgi:hypothetical protein
MPSSLRGLQTSLKISTTMKLTNVIKATIAT